MNVKIRSSHKIRQRRHSAEQWRCFVQLKEAQSAITPGQTAVFYRDEVVTGGGTIEQVNTNTENWLRAVIVFFCGPKGLFC